MRPFTLVQPKTVRRPGALPRGVMRTSLYRTHVCRSLRALYAVCVSRCARHRLFDQNAPDISAHYAHTLAYRTHTHSLTPRQSHSARHPRAPFFVAAVTEVKARIRQTTKQAARKQAVISYDPLLELVLWEHLCTRHTLPHPPSSIHQYSPAPDDAM